MIKKKALEPLIATILLIVVAVILVTIVLAWGKNFSTSSLDKTADLTNDACSGAAITLSNCVVDADGNIVFHVKNIGANYSFASTDTFKVLASDNLGNTYGESNLTYTTAWAGLTTGQTMIADVNATTLSTSSANVNVTVTVRSTTCPQASKTIYNCHK